MLIYWSARPASSEMEELRSIEAQLELPKSVSRQENDSGLHTSFKGVEHNDRYIVAYYEDKEKIEEIVASFAKNGWSLTQPEPLSTRTYWKFANQSKTACSSVWMDTEVDDISDLGMFIHHGSSDGCEWAFD